MSVMSNVVINEKKEILAMKERNQKEEKWRNGRQ